MLFPIETAYRFVMQRRRQQFAIAPVRVEGCTIVSVGNLTTGGTGKTPCVQWIARHFQNGGARVAIVARGYGGTMSSQGAIVSDGTTIFQDAREVGDEPLLHARALSDVAVVIGRDRIEAARRAVRECGAEVIVLDDGFQYWSLARDCDLVLLDARRPFGNGHLLPRGRLREEAAALGRASAIGLTRADAATTDQLAATRAQVRTQSDAPIFEARHAPAELRREFGPRENATDGSSITDEARTDEAANGETINSETTNGEATKAGDEWRFASRRSLESLRGARVVALSALADNANFQRTLIDLGACVASHVARRDHHAWREWEMRRAARLAQENDALLITTEKDAVKMQAFDLPVALWSLVIALQITRGEDDLRALLDHAIT